MPEEIKKKSFIEILDDEKSKFVLGGKTFYIFELPTARIEIFVEKLRSIVSTSFDKSKNIDFVKSPLSYLSNIPIDSFLELFNFICFPECCLGCTSWMDNECPNCANKKTRNVDIKWLKKYIAPRHFKELGKEMFRQAQLEEMLPFFLWALKELAIDWVLMIKRILNQVAEQK